MVAVRRGDVLLARLDPSLGVEIKNGERHSQRLGTTISSPREAKVEKSSALNVRSVTPFSLSAHSAMTASYVRPPEIPSSTARLSSAR